MQSIKNNHSFRRAFPFYVLLFFISIIIPPVLVHFNPPFVFCVSSDLLQSYFKLFLTTTTVLFLIIYFIHFRNIFHEPLLEILPVIVPILVLLNILYQMNQFPQKSFDYECYENAAKAIVAGENPYAYKQRPYIYPPLVAWIMALEHNLFEKLPLETDANQKEDVSWVLVAYFHQCGQFISILLAYYLCYCFLRSGGVDNFWASLVTGGILLFNTPLMMTLRLSQVNVWVLDLILLTILLQAKYPSLGGISIAIGAHIKLFPLILLIPATLKKKFATLFATILTFFFIIGIQTGFGTNLGMWRDYIISISAYLGKRDPYGTGLYSIAHYCLKGPFWLFGIDQRWQDPVTKIAILMLVIAIAIIFVYRYILREKAGKQDNENPGLDTAGYTLSSHFIDATIFILLISTVAWLHHYVLAIPAVLWAYATSSKEKHLILFILAFLIFCIPPLYIFPFKYIPFVAIVILAIKFPFTRLERLQEG